MVTLKIDGREIQVQENSTVLEAALAAGVKIPTLCNLKDINQIGACRMCLVEDAKSGKLQASCALPVSEGMDIITNSPKVLNARRAVLELILSDHDRSCLTCKRNQTCELQALADELPPLSRRQHRIGGADLLAEDGVIHGIDLQTVQAAVRRRPAELSPVPAGPALDGIGKLHMSLPPACQEMVS